MTAPPTSPRWRRNTDYRVADSLPLQDRTTEISPRPARPGTAPRGHRLSFRAAFAAGLPLGPGLGPGLAPRASAAGAAVQRTGFAAPDRRGPEQKAAGLDRLAVRLRPQSRRAVLDHRTDPDRGRDLLVAGAAGRPPARERRGVLHADPGFCRPRRQARPAAPAGVFRRLGDLRPDPAIRLHRLPLEFVGHRLDHSRHARQYFHPAGGHFRRAWADLAHRVPRRPALVQAPRAVGPGGRPARLGGFRHLAVADAGAPHRHYRGDGAAGFPGAGFL